MKRKVILIAICVVIFSFIGYVKFFKTNKPTPEELNKLRILRRANDSIEDIYQKNLKRSTDSLLSKKKYLGVNDRKASYNSPTTHEDVSPDILKGDAASAVKKTL